MKKLFRTERGANKRMQLNEIRWTKRNVIQRTKVSSVTYLTVSCNERK